MAKRFEDYNDFETASYFHNRCLDISIEFKYIEGEALAHRGLGIAEEKVFNKYEAMGHLETASEKAKEGQIQSAIKLISNDLVRVYQLIADENLDKVRSLLTQSAPLDAEDEQIKHDSIEMAKKYFSRCLEVSL